MFTTTHRWPREMLPCPRPPPLPFIWMTAVTLNFRERKTQLVVWKCKLTVQGFYKLRLPGTAAAMESVEVQERKVQDAEEIA